VLLKVPVQKRYKAAVLLAGGIWVRGGDLDSPHLSALIQEHDGTDHDDEIEH
jgi:hypothetical protein